MNADGSNTSFLSASSDPSDCGPLSGANPAWSPDGKQIAFDSHPSCVRGTGISVYMMKADGSGLIHFGSIWAFSPAWSPDGKYIAFATGGIFIMKIDGSSIVELTKDGSQPAWSR